MICWQVPRNCQEHISETNVWTTVDQYFLLVHWCSMWSDLDHSAHRNTLEIQDFCTVFPLQSTVPRENCLYWFGADLLLLSCGHLPLPPSGPGMWSSPQSSSSSSSLPLISQPAQPPSSLSSSSSPTSLSSLLSKCGSLLHLSWFLKISEALKY